MWEKDKNNDKWGEGFEMVFEKLLKKMKIIKVNLPFHIQFT
jgi:hypothetical protein